MAFSSEIKARLGLDISGMTSSLGKAKSQLSLWGVDAGKIMGKAFDFSNIIKGFMGGLGIGSALSVINTLGESLKGALGHSEKLGTHMRDIADNAQRAALEIAKVGKTEEQIAQQQEDRLDRIKKKRDDLLNSSGSQSFFGGLIEKGSALDKLFGFARDEDIKRLETVKQLNKEIGEIKITTAKAAEKIEEANFDQEQRNFRLRLDYVRQNREWLELEAKLISGRILPAERAKLEVYRKQHEIRLNNEKIEAILAKYPEQRTEADKANLAIALNHGEVLEKQLTEKEKILAATKEQATAEATVGKVIDSNLAKWKDFKIAITSSGRGDKDLDDAELDRKIDQLERDIFSRESALFTGIGFDAGAAASGGQHDALLGPQRNNLRQALSERNFRARVRNEAAFFGEDFAFRNNPGLSTSKLQDLLRGTTEDRRIARDTRDALKDLTQILNRGVPTVSLGGG